ncbi:MAG: hypothetical protein WCE51_07110 [Chthoniobacterales bacterium]
MKKLLCTLLITQLFSFLACRAQEAPNKEQAAAIQAALQKVDPGYRSNQAYQIRLEHEEGDGYRTRGEVLLQPGLTLEQGRMVVLLHCDFAPGLVQVGGGA